VAAVKAGTAAGAAAAAAAVAAVTRLKSHRVLFFFLDLILLLGTVP